MMENIYETVSDDDLVEILIRIVEVDHYDPTRTPRDVVKYRNLGFCQSSARSEILRRMNNS